MRNPIVADPIVADVIVAERTARGPIYLDYAATTPVDARVAAIMADCLTTEGHFGNPASTTHAYGRDASVIVERARAQVAALIGARPAEIIFTSGATESINLAILGVTRANADRRRHVVTARTEHRATLDACRQAGKEGYDITYLTPDRLGHIAAEHVAAALRADTALVSLMHVNNEIGLVHDIESIGELCRDRGVLVHCDAAQSAGKLPLDVTRLNVDLLSFSAHKLNGPKGIGALYVAERARAWIMPLLFGGGQERGLRSGTLPTHQIAGFGAACEIAARALDSEPGRFAQYRDRLWRGLEALPRIHRNGDAERCAPHILSVSFEGVEGESLVRALPGIAVSTGSACSSATAEPSYVLRALGRSTELAQSSLRFSVGRWTTEVEVDAAIADVREAVCALRALAGEGVGRASLPASLAHLTHARAVAGDVAPHDAAAREGAGIHHVTGQAGEQAGGTCVHFDLLVRGALVERATFTAYGCPDTLEVANWVAGAMSGRALPDVLPGDPATWLAKFGVPVEKLGRLLVVEDAVRACSENWSCQLRGATA